jgi:hypothetical protein
MTLHRTTARGALLTLIALLLGAGAASASSAGKVPTIVFPVLGESAYQDDFGDPRGGGRGHEGNDIMAPRRALALAAEAGTVKFWTTSARAGCMLYLDGESGTQYLYIHLNNDLEGDDNRGSCVPGVAYAKGLKSGAKVAAGQVIGYVGDSGDAEGGAPHLHFEMHPNGGGAVNPFKYLRKANRLLFSAEPGTTFTLALTGTVANAAGEDLQLSVDQVRQWPGGRKVKQNGQQVGVSVPETASVEGVGGAAGIAPYPALELLTKGLSVTVWTEPGKVSFAALSGAKGTLSASRVVVKP